MSAVLTPMDEFVAYERWAELREKALLSLIEFDELSALDVALGGKGEAASLDALLTSGSGGVR